MLMAAEPRSVNHVVNPLIKIFDVVDAPGKFKVFPNKHVLVQGVVFRQITNLGPGFHAFIRHVKAANGRPAR